MGTSTLDNEFVKTSTSDDSVDGDWAEPDSVYASFLRVPPTIGLRPGAFTDEDVLEMDRLSAQGIGVQTRPRRRVHRKD